MKAVQSRDARIVVTRSIVSAHSSGSSSNQSSSPSSSASVGDYANSHQDKGFSGVPQSPFWQQQQTRIFHESPPSRQHKLKVPPKKGIIRAKSASVNALSKSHFYEKATPPFISLNGSGNSKKSSKRRSQPRQQRQLLDDDPLMLHDNYSRELPDVYGYDDEQALSSSSFDPMVLSDQAVAEHAAAVEAEGVSAPKISIVDAYYAAKTIDLAPLIISDFSKNAVERKYSKDSLILQLSPPSSSSDKTSLPSYVAVYRFGPIIFFNVGPREKTKLLESVKRHALEPVAAGFEQRDSFGVCVMPEVSSARTPRVTSEHAIVHKLNLSSVSVVSEVMAQSVALDSYNDIVDALLENFAVVNSNIATTSQMDKSLDKKQLFSKIAENNRIFIDLISKLRIKGRSQIAWDQSEYEVIHSGMTTEFDIDDRFELIQFKLDLIQQNSKLFLEVIHHQKSASVEWVIVGLIGVECVLMCLDMSGQGTVMFEFAKELIT